MIQNTPCNWRFLIWISLLKTYLLLCYFFLVSMGGGYSIQVKNIIDAHSNTFELAQELFF